MQSNVLDLLKLSQDKNRQENEMLRKVRGDQQLMIKSLEDQVDSL
jgi:hypothetical protein